MPTRLTCTQEFYLQTISNTDESLLLNDMTALADGSVVACGKSTIGGVNHLVMIRFAADGTKLWERAFGYPGQGTLYRIIRTNDGNFLATGSSNETLRENIFIKLNPAGNLVWFKRNTYNTVESPAATAIKEGPDGSIYLVTKFSENSINFQDLIGFHKYDALGNMIYSKVLKFAEASRTVVNAEDIVVSNDRTYIAGSVSNYYYFLGQLTCINNASGNVEWSRIYNFNSHSLAFKSIHLLGNSLVLCGRNDVHGTDTSVIMYADMNGNVIKTYYLQYDALRDDERYAIMPDGTIYYSVSYRRNFTEFVFNIAKIHPDHGVSWMKENTPLPASSRVMTFISTPAGLYYLGSSFPSLSTSYSFLGRLTADENSNCPSDYRYPIFGVATGTSRDTTLVAYSKNLYPIADSRTPIATSSQIVNLVCQVPSICDSIDIPASASTCLGADTLKFPVYKNPGCNQPVIFDYDTSFVKQSAIQGQQGVFELRKPGSSKIYASITTDCGLLIDSITVNVSSGLNPESGNSTTLCEGEPLSLQATPGFVGYVWSDGSTAPSLSVSAAGIYWVKVTGADGCVSRDTAVVSVRRSPADFIAKQVEFCPETILELFPNRRFNEYKWGDGQTTSMISVYRAGSYTLEVTDEFGCTGVETIAVTEKGCFEGVIFPNAFTPNGDRKNDEFKPAIGVVLSRYRLEIFNRWGGRVFSTADGSKGWNGTVNGVLQGSGIYTWSCSYSVGGGPVVKDKGMVLLIK